MLALLTVLLSSLALAVDPRFAENITVYHVNEHKYGAIPVNMNTGDAVGDLFFDLLEVVIAPLACQHHKKPTHPGPDPCANPEAVGADLMVNKVTLEVDKRLSGYGACNVGINGSDPFGKPCATDTYCCDCNDGGSHWPPEPAPCNTTLGVENVHEVFSRFIGTGGCKRSIFKPFPKPADCYTSNAFSKLNAQEHGNWYSSLATGYCGDKGSACTWRVVRVDKIVKRTCHTRVFGDVVQAAGEPACLEACGSQKTNVTSPCWVDCFYKAALGPDSYKPGGAVAGLTLDALKAAWLKPFEPEAEGGCPSEPEALPWFAHKEALEGARVGQGLVEE